MNDILMSLNKELENILQAIGSHLQNVPAKIALAQLHDKAELVITLRDLKTNVREFLRLLNKTLNSAEQDLCITIAKECDGGITYRADRGTITASAKGYFTIKEPMQFLRWLQGRESHEQALESFVKYANSKSAREELCEGFLGKGEKLPPGILEHIQASVKIRRKANGEKETR